MERPGGVLLEASPNRSVVSSIVLWSRKSKAYVRLMTRRNQTVSCRCDVRKQAGTMCGYGMPLLSPAIRASLHERPLCAVTER